MAQKEREVADEDNGLFWIEILKKDVGGFTT